MQVMNPTSSKRLRSSALKLGAALIFLISIFIAANAIPSCGSTYHADRYVFCGLHFPNSRLAPALLRRCYAAIRARSSRLRGGAPWLSVMCGKFHIFSGSNTNVARPPDVELPGLARQIRGRFGVAIFVLHCGKALQIGDIGEGGDGGAIGQPGQ